MHLDLVYLPSELRGVDLSTRTAVVFDVLRATTSMVTALAHGAAEIRAFGELDEARTAHAAFDGPRLLAGESNTVMPAGFDLGNRPPQFTPDRVAGRTIFMATTNGTRAIRACATARRTLIATLANASATARALAADGGDVMFVSSGVNGAPGGEDVDGIATVADLVARMSPSATLSTRLREEVKSCSWVSNDVDRVQRLRDSPGGRNIIKVGLDADIPFVAEVDRFDVVAEVTHGAAWATIRVRATPASPANAGRQSAA